MNKIYQKSFPDVENVSKGPFGALRVRSHFQSCGRQLLGIFRRYCVCLCGTNGNNNEDPRQKLSGMTALFYKGAARTGFTLIELLVVVLIIGILSAIALPQYEKAVEKSRAAEAVAWLKILRDQQAVCIMEHGGYESVCGQPDEPGGPSLFNSSGITLPGTLDNDCGYYGGCLSTKYFTYYLDGQYIDAERNPFDNSKYMLETTALNQLGEVRFNRIMCGGEEGWCQKIGFTKEENGSWYQP